MLDYIRFGGKMHDDPEKSLERHYEIV